MSRTESDPLLDPGILDLRRQLEAHDLFRSIDGMPALRRFMQVHVFAVWDFMSLVKRLQIDLTCTRLPWMPPADPEAARLINDIVLAEESDVDPEGRAASHLELYLSAMREVGADTAPFEAFMRRIRSGVDAAEALNHPDVPEFVGDFVVSTLGTALHGSTLEVMASFFHGRENIIPDMFLGLLKLWRVPVEDAPCFVYYLQRHIELDGDTHGPAAQQLISRALEADPSQLHGAREAARDALHARRNLWDQTLAMLRPRHQSREEPARALA